MEIRWTRNRDPISFPLTTKWETFYGEDLYYSFSDKRLCVPALDIEELVYFPMDCKTVTMSFTAKLLDRKTREVIETEDVSVDIMIHKYRRVSLGS